VIFTRAFVPSESSSLICKTGGLVTDDANRPRAAPFTAIIYPFAGGRFAFHDIVTPLSMQQLDFGENRHAAARIFH
jgi:hypothetical protein